MITASIMENVEFREIKRNRELSVVLGLNVHYAVKFSCSANSRPRNARCNCETSTRGRPCRLMARRVISFPRSEAGHVERAATGGGDECKMPSAAEAEVQPRLRVKFRPRAAARLEIEAEVCSNIRDDLFARKEIPGDTVRV